MAKRTHRMIMPRRGHYRPLRGEPVIRRSTVPVLGAAALVGALIGVAPSLADAGPAIASAFRATRESATTATMRYAEPLTGCSVTDGDTIRCGSERIRLIGIDAPELPGHCRSGRDCAPGDPYASTASLVSAMTGSLTVERVGEDHYGRTLAVVAGTNGDLSCWQLAHHQAIYKPGWDNGMRVARTCPRNLL